MWRHAAPVRAALPGGLASRSFARTPSPALVLVDGQQSLDLVRAQLSLRLAANTQGVDVLVAGKQGVAIALRAVAQLRQDRGRPPSAFHLAKAGSEELHEAGLSPPGHGLKYEGQDSHEDDSGLGRQGFRLSILPASAPSPVMESTVALDAPVARVLRVKGGSGQFVQLAKAIATEVARLPDGSVAAVETALKGKSKNLWARTYRVALAVAQAHQWQIAPANDKLVTRRFRCIADERESEDVVFGGDGVGDGDADIVSKAGFRVLRLTLIPEEPRPASRAST